MPKLTNLSICKVTASFTRLNLDRISTYYTVYTLQTKYTVHSPHATYIILNRIVWGCKNRFQLFPLEAPIFQIKKASVYYKKQQYAVISGQFRCFLISEIGKRSTLFDSRWTNWIIQKRGGHEIALLPLWLKYHQWMKEVGSLSVNLAFWDMCEYLYR